MRSEARGTRGEVIYPKIIYSFFLSSNLAPRACISSLPNLSPLIEAGGENFAGVFGLLDVGQAGAV
jgi:hypothetical protein